MATATPLPLEQYLATSYRPDCDYADGELEERNWGEREHARLQAALTAWFHGHVKAWGLEVLVEQRVRVSTGRVRIPDSSVHLDLVEVFVSTPPSQ